MKHSHQNPIARPDGQIARMHSSDSFHERTAHQYTGGRPGWMEGQDPDAKPTSTTLGAIKRSSARKRRQRDALVEREQDQ
jgi:hypothetical protein